MPATSRLKILCRRFAVRGGGKADENIRRYTCMKTFGTETQLTRANAGDTLGGGQHTEGPPVDDRPAGDPEMDVVEPDEPLDVPVVHDPGDAREQQRVHPPRASGVPAKCFDPDALAL